MTYSVLIYLVKLNVCLSLEFDLKRKLTAFATNKILLHFNEEIIRQKEGALFISSKSLPHERTLRELVFIKIIIPSNSHLRGNGVHTFVV